MRWMRTGRFIFFMQDNDNYLTQKQGQTLVKLAKQTIMEKLERSMPASESDLLKMALTDKIFELCRGVFVTLNIKNGLRGCIGSLSATESILDGIKHNAINAAFNDPRFPALSKDELEHVDIEISILTESQPIEYNDSADLISKLRPNIDGVILSKGFHSATFLPQVWEQLPKCEDFLTHLCQKAGLPFDAWKRDKLKIMIYQVQCFKEEK